MRAFTFVFVLLLFCRNGRAQENAIAINGNKFLFVGKTEWSEYNRYDSVVKMYRIENGKIKYLLKHYTYRYSADCNNSFTDIGTYKVQNDSVLFLTEFNQMTGMDPIPERRKQIYKVGEGGKLTLLYDKQQERNSGEWVDSNYK